MIITYMKNDNGNDNDDDEEYFKDIPKLNDKIFNFLPIRRCDKRLLTNYVCMKQL